jgi:two-component system, response regulator PhcR
MTPSSLDADTILYIDDEKQACKWFAKTFGTQFNIVTVESAVKALSFLNERVAVVVCDHRMPVLTGLDFLTQISRTHPGIVRILTSAYTDKSLLIDAISNSEVAFFIEKPWQPDEVFKKLGQALSNYRRQALEQHAIKNSLTSSKSALGFLAHELNTPLAIVNGYLEMLSEGFTKQLNAQVDIYTNQSGNSFDASSVINTIQQQIFYMSRILNASVQAAKMVMLEQEAPIVSASALVGSVVQRFSVSQSVRPSVVIEQDFSLTCSNDLIHLALCSVVQNAVKAMKETINPQLKIILGMTAADCLRAPSYFIRVSDNGAGVPISVLENLKACRPSDSESGTGMGLLFCKRVIESLCGEFQVESRHLQGNALSAGVSTQVTFLFNAIKI